jgi:hypothetical protein
MPPLVHTVRISKRYASGADVVRAVRDVSVSIEHGEFDRSRHIRRDPLFLRGPEDLAEWTSRTQSGLGWRRRRQLKYEPNIPASDGCTCGLIQLLDGAFCCSPPES